MSDEMTNASAGSGGSDGGGEHDDFDLPLSSSESGPSSASSGAGPDATQQPAIATPGTDTGGETFPVELTEALRREGLRPVPGESSTAAYARLTGHIAGKSREYRRQIHEMRQEIAGSRAEMRQYLEPILREHYQRQQMQQLEEQEAQIPPKDSPEYQVWLNEQILARMEAREKEDWERAQAAERAQAEELTQAELATIDATGYGKVAEGLGLVQGTQPDPEFAHAYDIFSNSAIAAARGYFPDATDQQIQEFVALSQRLDIRRAEMNGVDIRDVMKQRLNGMVDALVAAGIVQRANRAATPTVDGTAAASGNGTGKPAQSTAPQPTAAQRVAAESAASARRAPLATPSATRPTQLPGQLPDPASFEDEDAYLDAALSGILGNEEQRVAGHRKQR